MRILWLHPALIVIQEPPFRKKVSKLYWSTSNVFPMQSAASLPAHTGATEITMKAKHQQSIFAMPCEHLNMDLVIYSY